MRAMAFLAPSFLASIAATDIVVLHVVHGDEQVALAHLRLTEHGEGRRIALDRNHVGKAPHVGKQLLVGVDDGNVVAIATEHFRQMASHFARTRNNDFHTGFTLSAYARIIPGSIFAINNTNV